MNTFADYGIFFSSSNVYNSEVDTLCPQCSSNRKKRRAKCLSVNTEKGTWFCHHCGWTGGLEKGEQNVQRIERNVVSATRVPSSNPDRITPTYTITPNPPEFYEWFNKRGISQQVVDRYKITRAEHYMVAREARVPVMCFPYYRGEQIINIKYRDGEKNFQMVGGAERVLYGLDECVDSRTIVVVEGEIDKLSLAELGIYNVVSVPDGAPSPRARNYTSKFDFLDKDDVVSMFDNAKMVILATDSDEPGIHLRDELSRRFGKEKCWLATYPEDCKDINDVLVKHGKEAVMSVLDGIMPYPIEGIVEIEDVSENLINLYHNGISRGVSTGWNSLDRYYTVKTSYWTLVTGIPSHGKSEFLDALMVNLAKHHEWKFAVCSPENYPFEYHVQKLCEKVVGKPFFVDPILSPSAQRMSLEEVESAKLWLGDHFSFLAPELPTLDNILSLAKVLILRKGIKGLVIDPFNMLESMRDSRQSETDYIGECLTKITRFAAFHDIHIWVVAHPTKMDTLADGSQPVPRPYDIAGSAHWANRPRFIMAVYRDLKNSTRPTEIHIQKVSLKYCGDVGVVPLNYNRLTGQYYETRNTAAQTQYDGTMF